MPSEALPVLVDCEPYRTRLTKDSCVRRFAIATHGWKKGDPAGSEAAKSAQLRESKCRNCPIGAERYAGAPVSGKVDTTRKRKGTKKCPGCGSATHSKGLCTACLEEGSKGKRVNPNIALREARDVAETKPKEIEMPKEKLEKRGCEECETPFMPKRKDSRHCSKKCRVTAANRAHREKVRGGKPAKVRTTPAPAKKKASSSTRTVGDLLALYMKLEQRKAEHVEEIEVLEGDIEEFESAHPELLDQAEEMLQRITKRKAA